MKSQGNNLVKLKPEEQRLVGLVAGTVKQIFVIFVFILLFPFLLVFVHLLRNLFHSYAPRKLL